MCTLWKSHPALTVLRGVTNSQHQLASAASSLSHCRLGTAPWTHWPQAANSWDELGTTGWLQQRLWRETKSQLGNERLPLVKEETSSWNERQGGCVLCWMWGNMLRDGLTPGQTERLKGSDFHFCSAASGSSPLCYDHSPSHHILSIYRMEDLPDDRRLPLLPLIIFPLLPMLANFEVLSVPVSVRSIAISLRLLAAWILDWTWTKELVMA